MNSQNVADQLDAAIDRTKVQDDVVVPPAVSELLEIATELRLVARPGFKESLKAALEAQAEKMKAGGQAKQDVVIPTLFSGSYGVFPVQRTNLVVSFLLHSAAMVLILTSGFWMVQNATGVKPNVVSVLTDVSPYTLPPDLNQSGGGGGGGDNDKLAASQGNPPKFAKEQLTPPTVILRNNDPKLAVESTVVGPPSLTFPQTAQMGNPLSSILAPSNGVGRSGGIGDGRGTGVGSGYGPGVGPGYGGGMGGGLFKVGGGVTAPRPIYDPDPEYSDEARRAKYQGTVLLWVVIDANGRPHEVKVSRSLGMGLDEKAIEAVKNWRFTPAKKDGQPVAVQVTIEVSFRLY